MIIIMLWIIVVIILSILLKYLSRKHLFFKFGKVSTEQLFKAIFIIGLIPIIAIGLLLPFFNVDFMPLVNFRAIFYGMQIPILGYYLYYLFILLFFVLVAIIIWKLICELLFLILEVWKCL